MGEHEITCVVHNKYEVITDVGIGSRTYTIDQVVSDIRNGLNSFYTIKNGYRARVYAKQHPTTLRWFLTTEPDRIQENNLDFLRRCY